MTTPLITADNVSLARQGQPILQNISLAINEGDFVTLIGPNGAGKSLLLKCLLGFYRPDSGTIKRKKNLTIGYVPQHLTPDHTMPISTQRFLRLHKKTDAHHIRTISQQTGIADILHKPLAALSGGELQHVLLTRSLLDNPEVLILDEPAQNLDISGQLGFYKRLQRIYNERPLTILMVSHDLHMVMACTKQVICLFHHICCSGTPQAVTRDPEFISLFGDDMANMMAVYQHSHDHSHDSTHDHNHNHGHTPLPDQQHKHKGKHNKKPSGTIDADKNADKKNTEKNEGKYV